MLTRRNFVRTVGIGAAGALTSSWIGARGREDSLWSVLEPGLHAQTAAPPANMIVLSSNENPLGPGKTVMDAVQKAFGPNGAAPGRYSSAVGALTEAIAKKHNVTPQNVLLACGSTQILRTATHVFTSRTKAMVGTIPTYEECAGYAEMMGRPVRAVALDSSFRIDLDKFADASKGAGLVFYCNPNNPTATYVGARATRDFLAKVTRESPGTTVLVDEAYFEYVTASDYRSALDLARERPNVIVLRTFSKIYSLASLRVGYAIGQPSTLADLRRAQAPFTVNGLAQVAALTAVQYPNRVAERAEFNAVQRGQVETALEERHVEFVPSQANFVYLRPGSIGQDAFQAFLQLGVIVRQFGGGWVRVTIGSVEENQRFLQALDSLL